MKITDLKGKKVTVMGLGLHGGGVGTIKFLAKLGAKIVVTDIKTKETLKFSLDKLKGLKSVSFVFGQHRREDFINADLIMKTPGVAWENQYIKLALSKKIPVETDASLFFKFCKNKIIGITGTKGKTTTATLISQILEESGKNCLKVGIGQISVLDRLERIKKDTIVVFELSSWRLASLGRFNLSPHIAIWTNFFPDHLNYYKNLESYKKDKEYIFSSQKDSDFAVVNWEQEELRMLEEKIKSTLIKYSASRNLGENSVYLENDDIIFEKNGEKKKIMSVDEVKVLGKHNLNNILAACGATLILGIGVNEIKKAVQNFSAISHRLEFVREISGVKYYNDTAATTPESAMAGIDSFSSPIILIAGGADKKLVVENLAQKIKEKIKEVIFIKGLATDKIIHELKKSGSRKNFPVVDSMEKAVELSQEMAGDGDIVLLSPGAASFGVFQNEFDRGDKFREAVKNLK